MTSCVLYFSQTGNTKKFAQTIADSIATQSVYDINATNPFVVDEYDVIILGTPVHGFNPSKESLAFVERLPECKDKQAILFCTYRLWKGRVFSKLKKELKKKGYSTVLCVSAKGKDFSTETFTEQVSKIKGALN